ncbi:LysR family transcriptional regulator [Shewanella youngdeokensis]|uniref:LysR family transcriptional regulator n=1 Tax=Shewanella youngdeokensis TaxID=2999068 RepID=A0ABZ0JZS4_9GAMM|nr:LysR family transcriptional regulator [Shewanella sp. DAU334]
MPAKDILKLSVLHMNILKKIVESGSAGVAAEELALSTSAVSYRLATMREMFNDELFIRTNDGLKPTDYCRRLALSVNNILNQIEEELFHAGSFNPQQINRRLVVHGDITTIGWFPRLFSELATLCPRLDLSFHSWNHHSQEDIIGGKVDFGIHMLPNSTAGINEVELTSCQRIFIAHSNHPLAKIGRVSLEDLSNYQVLMSDLSGWNSYGRSTMERVLAEHGFTLNIKGRFGDCSALFDTIRTGNYLTYTSTLALPRDLTNLTIIPAPAALIKNKSSYRLKLSSQRYGSQEYAWLAETLARSFKEFAQSQNTRTELMHIESITR